MCWPVNHNPSVDGKMDCSCTLHRVKAAQIEDYWAVLALPEASRLCWSASGQDQVGPLQPSNPLLACLYLICRPKTQRWPSKTRLMIIWKVNAVLNVKGPMLSLAIATKLSVLAIATTKCLPSPHLLPLPSLHLHVVISATSGTFKPVDAFTKLDCNVALNFDYRNLTYPVSLFYSRGLRPPIQHSTWHTTQHTTQHANSIPFF